MRYFSSAYSNLSSRVGFFVCNLLLIEQFGAVVDLAPLYKADELIASISILANCGSTLGYYVTMVYAVRRISFVRRLRLHDPATSSRYRHHRERGQQPTQPTRTQTDQRSLIVISYNLMRILRSVVDRSIVAAIPVGDRRIN